MIKGLLHWEEEKRYCSQENNAIEKARKDMASRGYYETCNMESIYIGLDCRGDIDISGNPSWMGLDCQPSDFMFCHINWGKYDKTYSSGSAMDNRSIYNMAKMLQKMGYQTEIVKNPEASFFKRHLPNNHPVIINIPKHYCCAIAWDYLKGELIHHNPWPGDKRNKNKGVHERLRLDNKDIPVKYGLAFWK